jgi:hypothetical protein
MARLIKLPTVERGEIVVLAIAERGGTWEPDWEPLRGTVYGKQFTLVDRETLEHALRGFSRPLSNALGIPPVGALRKVPKPSRECYTRRKCPFYAPRHCHPEAAKMPWCFEPDAVKDEKVRKAAAQAIEQWREGVYLVVVHHDD